jgi:hypothetical protein
LARRKILVQLLYGNLVGRPGSWFRPIW